MTAKFSNMVADEPRNTHRSIFSTSKVWGEADSSNPPRCSGEVSMVCGES